MHTNKVKYYVKLSFILLLISNKQNIIIIKYLGG